LEQHEISPILSERLTSVYGDSGRDWIAGFPALLNRIRSEWDLAGIGATFPYVGYAWVAPVTLANGGKAVLKLAPPDKEFASEIGALGIYAGRGAAKLLASDPAATALLLERLEPGTTLAELNDDILATEIAGQSFTRLFRPLPAGHSFPTIERWGQAFARVRAANDGGSGRFPPELFDPAERIYFELGAGQDEPMLLHGDLHHWNILRAEREPWLAIDPKGLAGEPAYEVGALLRNRLDAGEDVLQLTLRRIAQLSEILGVDRERLKRWAFAQGVLSALWTFEDHGELGEKHLVLPRALLPAIAGA